MINIAKAPKSKENDKNYKKGRKPGLRYNNIEKKSKNFMYRNLEKSSCYNCDFEYSNFDYSSFRGADFKASNFDGCSFRFAEFVGTNFKNSSMKGAILKNALFNSAKLEGVSFKDAKFENTIFLNTDISKAKNITEDMEGVIILAEIPQIDISDELTVAIINAMNNLYIKESRVLDTSEGGMNFLSIKLLLDYFEEKELIYMLNYMSENIEKPFYTLSYIIKYIRNYKITC
ncbi:MAG: pentapeptide repeat-containing protein [Proteocatella sp.]